MSIKAIAPRSDFPLLAADPKLHYLDSAATTQKPRVVLDAIAGYYARDNANPHRGAYTLSAAGHASHAGRVALIVLAVASVTLAWACVHTVFTLRYARLYNTPPVGGIGFPEGTVPDYLDLAYVAFTIGMTFQVSDTDLSKKGIRRTAIHHALLSYLFGAVILAVAVNTVASLLGR